MKDLATFLVLAALSISSMFPLLMRLVKKVCGKVLQSHIIMVKVVRGVWTGRALVWFGGWWWPLNPGGHSSAPARRNWPSQQAVGAWRLPEGSVRRGQRTGPQWQAIWVPWKDYWTRKPRWLFCKEPLLYCIVALVCISLIILNIFSHTYLSFLYP